MKHARYLGGIVFLLSFLLCTRLWSDNSNAGPDGSSPLPLLHPLFSSHAVLQRDRPVRIWGWAAAGSEVTVQLGSDRAAAKATADGRWDAEFPAHPAGVEATLRVSSGAENVESTDLVFGDVWLCCGQSNMAFWLRSSSTAKEDVSQSANAKLRLFKSPGKVALEPGRVPETAWAVSSAETTGKFSAVAYHFGRVLVAETGVPIGLISVSYGGSTSHAWLSESSLKSRKELEKIASSLPVIREKGLHPEFRESMSKWYQANDQGTRAGWLKSMPQGKTVALPATPANSGLEGFSGVVWLSRTFVSEANAVPASFRLSGISRRSTVYLNGEELTARGVDDRHLTIPIGLLKAGENRLIIRAFLGGFGKQADTDAAKAKAPLLGKLSIDVKGGSAIALDGNWSLKISTKLEGLPQPPDEPDYSPARLASGLYNGMIAPVEGVALRGGLWYQGETNNAAPPVYRKVILPLLLEEWRARFRSPDLAFGIVQLPGFGKPSNGASPGGAWPQIREAQAGAAHDIPGAFMAVTIDVGDEDVHPKNKRPVGERLAHRALAVVYSAANPATGPELAAWEFAGGEFRATFRNCAGGLNLRQVSTHAPEVTGFSLAGPDKQWHWAQARVDGEKLVLSSPNVPMPAYAAYAWSNRPPATLEGKDNLPAAPFNVGPDTKPMHTSK